MSQLQKRMTIQNFTEAIQNFTPEEREKYKKLADSIDLAHPETIDKYGTDINDTLNRVSDDIISKASESAAGEIGTYVSQLTNLMKDYQGQSNPSKFAQGLSRVPLLGRAIKAAGKIETKYNTIKKNVDTVTEALKASKLHLQSRNNELELSIASNKKYIVDLRERILGAMMKLDEAKEFRKSLDPESVESFELQRIDLTIGQLEKKIGDFMANMYAIGLNISEMQTIEDGNRKAIALSGQLIDLTVPVWKTTIASAIQIRELDRTVQVQDELREVTQKMIIDNSAHVKDSMIKITELNEKLTFDPETLRTATENIINMGEEILKIQHDCAESRKEIRRQLEELNSKMAHTLNLSD